MPDDIRDLDEFTVTDAVLEQMARTTNPRLREIMEAAVRHLHAFARETKLTPEEWLTGIAFLTRVGKMCSPARQEFILLSDVMGLSALVSAQHDRGAEELGTQTSLLGPFYRQGAPEFALGDSIAVHAKGSDLLLYGRVADREGRGIPNALVQVWQTDSEGIYDLQAHGIETMDMRGNFRTDADGNYHFRTTPPVGYSIPMDGPVGELVRAQSRHGCRPAHIHFLISADGYRELVTALYLGNDQYIDSDTVFGVSRSLVVAPKAGDADAPIKGIPAIRYDFALGAVTGEGSGRVGADPAQILAAAK